MMDLTMGSLSSLCSVIANLRVRLSTRGYGGTDRIRDGSMPSEKHFSNRQVLQ